MVYNVKDDVESLEFMLSLIKDNLGVNSTIVYFDFRSFTIPITASVELVNDYFLKVIDEDRVIGVIDVRKINAVYFG